MKTITKSARDLVRGDEVVREERSFTVLNDAVPFEHFLLTDQVRVWGTAGGKEGWVEFGASAQVDVKA